MIIKLTTIFILAILFSKLLIRGLLKTQLIDIPNSEVHKKHKNIVPLAGGIVLIISLLVSYMLFYEDLNFMNIYFIISALIIFLIGLLDDVKNLKARYKLLGQIIVGIILIQGGYRTDIFGGSLIDFALSIFWIVGIINAFNFLDGGDGLAIGVSSIILLSIGVQSSFISNQPGLFIACFSLFTITAVLYLFNKRPAKLFLGDSGSNLLGMILAVFGLFYAPIGYYKITSWIAPILIFSFPIFDVTLVVISRMRRGVSIFQPGLDHTYHRLRGMIQSHTKSNNLIFFFIVISNILAVISLMIAPIYGILLGVGAFIAFICLLVKFECSLIDQN